MKLDRRDERGAAMILVVVVCILLMAFAAAFMALTAAMTRQTSRDVLGLHALYCAETGAAIALAQLNSGALPTTNALGADGVLDPVNDPALAPILTGSLGGGNNERTYTITIALWGRDGLDNDGNGVMDDADGGESRAATITARGVAGGEIRQIECIVGRTPPNPFDNGIAGYGQSAANVAFGLTGTGTRADFVDGNIYIDGNMTVGGAANVNGQVVASGTVTDSSSAWNGQWEKGTQPGFDLKKQNYAVNNDVNVANALKTSAARKFLPGQPVGGGNAVGGNAWQVPSTDPAHIFRLNPSDRVSTYTGMGYTSVYALEDPYEQRRDDPNWNGTDATKISYTPGYEYGKVYYVGPTAPGEKVAMIIDNSTAYSYKFATPGAETSGQQTIIVVKGDIHIGDNIFQNNVDKDAVVFIALKNDDGTGGNINFGDSRFGTVEDFNAFMYAENDFISTNVSADASKVLIKGTMAAGRALRLNLGTGTSHHKLELIHDKRIMETLAGTAPAHRRLDGIVDDLPPTPMSAVGNFTVGSWRQIDPNQAPATKGYTFTPAASPSGQTQTP